MKLFGKKQVTTTKPSAQFKPTKKKKDTYAIKADDMIAPYFALCRETLLVPITINGKPVNRDGGFMDAKRFPNPAAQNMIKAVQSMKPIMGETLATTIISYKDKITAEPIIMLFPTNELVFMTQNGGTYTTRAFITNVGDDKILNMKMKIWDDGQQFAMSKYMTETLNRLNHATRADLFNQVQKRQNFLNQINMTHTR